MCNKKEKVIICLALLPLFLLGKQFFDCRNSFLEHLSDPLSSKKSWEMDNPRSDSLPYEAAINHEDYLPNKL